MDLEEVKYAQEVSSIKTHKLFWFLFFGLIFIIIVASLFLIFTPKTSERVSHKELIGGASLTLGENDSIGFEFGSEDHGIKIDFVGIDSAGVTIFSEPISFILELNEAKYLDMDNDGIYDIKVKLISIENGVATVKIQRMLLVSCDEKWECHNWSVCINGTQARGCTDLNNCGTKDDKPFEERKCINIEFSENNSGFENKSNNILNKTITGNLTNTTIPQINKTTSPSINISVGEKVIINCENGADYFCFINASKNCTPAIWNLSSSSIASPLVHYEIKGYADDGKCIYYEKYLEQNIEKICKINKEELTSIFTGYSQGHFSTADFYNAECYPRDNFNCKLDLAEGILQGMSLYFSPYGSISSQFSVKGYSDITKIIWSVQNSSVIKLEPTIGNYSVISPTAVGETFVVIKDTSLDSCELKIPFEVHGDETNTIN